MDKRPTSLLVCFWSILPKKRALHIGSAPGKGGWVWGSDEENGAAVAHKRVVVKPWERLPRIDNPVVIFEEKVPRSSNTRLRRGG